MKLLLTLILSLSFALSAFGQRNDSIPNVIDKDGLKQGKWRISWHDDEFSNNLKQDSGVTIGNYANDKKEGLWTYYFMSEKIKERIIYKNNIPSSILNCYSIKGGELDGGTLKDGNGILKEYFADGMLKVDCGYANGNLNGLYRRYNKYGGVATMVNYVNGLKQGFNIQYTDYKNNSYEQFMYMNDTLVKNYYRVSLKGVIVQELLPIDANLTKHCEYYPNGYPIYIQYFKVINGKSFKSNIWRSYNENGMLTKEIEYTGLVGRKERTYKNGNLIEEKTFEDSNEAVKNSKIDE